MTESDDEQERRKRLFDGPLAAFHWIEERSELPAVIIVTLIMSAIVVFFLLEHIEPLIAERLVPKEDRVETLLGLMVFLVGVSLRQAYKQAKWLAIERATLSHTLTDIRGGITGSLTQFERESSAYDALCIAVANTHIKRVDLLQLSGQTSMHLLQTLLEKRKRIQIRLLLLHPEIARLYNKTGRYEHHVDRIRATLGQIKTFDADQRVTIRIYKSEPSVCSVAVDDTVTCVGWYKRFFRGETLMIKSHDIAMLMDTGVRSTALKRFAKTHFNDMWDAPGTVGVGSLPELNDVESSD